MDYLNLHTSTLDSAEFLGADPIDRATWLCLLRYCAGQENSGIIDNCAEWGDRKWQQLCRVTKKEVSRRCALWGWLDGSITVKFYPVEKQAETQALRAQSKSAATKRWAKSRFGNAVVDAERMPDGMRNALPNAMQNGNQKRIEENRREEREAAHTPLAPPSEGKPKAEAKFRALLAEFGSVLIGKHGEDLFPQWLAAAGKTRLSRVEALFRDDGHRPSWPSELKKLLQTNQSEYAPL